MKKIILSLLVLLFLSSFAFAENNTSVSVDGMSLKDYKGVTFTAEFREVKKEDEGKLSISGKLITIGKSSLLDRAYDSKSKVKIVVINKNSDKESQEVSFIGALIKSVSKNKDNYVDKFVAESLE